MASETLVNTGSGNVLWFVQRKTITWTNADWGINSNAIWIKTQSFSFTKMHWKVSPTIWQPFSSGPFVNSTNPKCDNHLNKYTAHLRLSVKRHWGALVHLREYWMDWQETGAVKMKWNCGNPDVDVDILCMKWRQYRNTLSSDQINRCFTDIFKSISFKQN